MTTAPVDEPRRTASGAQRDAIESEIAGGTLLTAFAQTSRDCARVAAFRWQEAGEWRSLSYGKAREQVRDLTLGLRAIGLRPGEFAVIWSRNRPEPNLADMAVMHARGVPVFLYNTLVPEQAAYIADHCEAAVAIVEDRGFLARLASVRPRLPQLRRVVLIDGEARAGEDWLISWDDLLALGRAEAERWPGLFDSTWRQVGPENLATLIYTSGTTGPPKGVMITHRNVRYCAAAVTAVLPPSELADEAGIRMISYLPMAHSAGRFTGHWLPMIHPVTVAFCPDAAQLFRVAVEIRPTVLNGVPRLWEKLQAAARAGLAAEPDTAPRRAAEQVIEAGRQLVRFRQRGEPAPNQAAFRDEPAGRARRVRDRFDDLAGPPRDVLDQVTDDGSVQFSAADQAWVEHPAAGRIVLAGDAWHGTSPSMAQGGAMAAEDALVLAQELASHQGDGRPDPVGAALGRYAARRLPRVRHVQEATALRTSLAALPLAQRLGVVPAWQEISMRSFAPLVPDP